MKVVCIKKLCGYDYYKIDEIYNIEIRQFSYDVYIKNYTYCSFELKIDCNKYIWW